MHNFVIGKWERSYHYSNHDSNHVLAIALVLRQIFPVVPTALPPQLLAFTLRVKTRSYKTGHAYGITGLGEEDDMIKYHYRPVIGIIGNGTVVFEKI
jgi:hypothetical protein